MSQQSESRVLLPGSERAPLSGAVDAGPLDTAAQAEVTLVVRRRAELPYDVVAGSTVLSSGDLEARYGADPADVTLVGDALGRYGLTVASSHGASRRVKVSGSLADLSAAFGTSLRLVTSQDPNGQAVTHRLREGPLFVPTELDGVVTAILGLDDRPQARPHFRLGGERRHGHPQPKSTSYTPAQVADIYQFPAGADGSGQTIAILEFGGGFSASDLTSYFGGLGLPVPAVTAASVDGGANAPGSDPTGADVEVALDIDVAGAAAPGASQIVYFAPNSDQGFVDAVSEAAHASPAPVAISISWGQSENSWTAQSRVALDSAIADASVLGVTVCVAAGDNGSGDAVNDGAAHVDFPASSPHALACGGTKLEANAASGTITSEVVWNETAAGEGATGGGVSDQFPQPAWQASAGVPPRVGGSGTNSGRGVPDVTGNGDPTSGYQIMSDGKAQVVGGTSAVAPLWAALISLARAGDRPAVRPDLRSPLRRHLPWPKRCRFHHITSGNNGDYSAGPGWDACSGLGSPATAQPW